MFAVAGLLAGPAACVAPWLARFLLWPIRDSDEASAAPARSIFMSFQHLLSNLQSISGEVTVVTT